MRATSIVISLFVFFPQLLHANLKDFLTQSSQNRQTLWTRLSQHKPLPLTGIRINTPDSLYGDLILTYSSDPYKDRYPEAKWANAVKVPVPQGGTPYPIHYHAYMSRDVFLNPGKLKGIVIKAYGAMSKNLFSPRHVMSEERLLASQGYLVYNLNVRGTSGYGNEFLYSIAKEDGIYAQVNDVCYFATLLRQRHLRDADGNRPMLSLKIPPKTPIVFKGESYGGELGLLLATTSTPARVGGLTLRPSQTFDGVISVCGISEQYVDFCSFTTVARRRLNHFIPQKNMLTESTEWIKNCYPDVDLLHDSTANEKYSPIFRVNQIERPILLMHGLLDLNVSPLHSLRFQEEAEKCGKGRFIFPFYDENDDHMIPSTWGSTQVFYETLFRYLDFLYYKNKFRVRRSDFPTTKQKLIYEAGYTKFRSTNPDVHYPDFAFIDQSVRSLIDDRLFPSSKSLDQLWHHVTNTHWQAYIKALLFLNLLETSSNTHAHSIERLPNIGGMSLLACLEMILDDLHIGVTHHKFHDLLTLECFMNAYDKSNDAIGRDLLYKALNPSTNNTDGKIAYDRLENTLKQRLLDELTDANPYKTRAFLRAPLLDF